ncbi:polyadenylate-binding protein-interacting protein 1 [Procambarus clarkii]|uniref:polyadenylate-binding protein-interacting protein 1 n=1 Tax=Procambarus clarkii TaxID=6728 RepID=UPI001E670F35|nr:polyadenylate-binding protein-interacting protein 1-like [Procambarus clarkii]
MEAGGGRGRGRGRGVAAGEDHERGDLRRPHAPPEGPPPPQPPQQQLGAHTPLQTQSITAVAESQEAKAKKTFLLSADAPEFVPRTFVQPPAQHQIQIPNPAQNMHHHHQVTSPVVPQPQFHYTCHPVVLQVNNLVVQLTIKPNRFDQIARHLTTIFTWQVQDAFLMKELITVIFEQGVGEVNFRYSGARLCQHLSKNVTQAYNGPTFKSVLLQRCQEEFNVKDVYLHSEPARVCGFTLFLAELFTQLISPSDQTLDILRGALCQLLTTLLSQPTDSNLKCVAQVLKFTGSIIDASNRNEMDQVMCNVKDVAMTAPVKASTRSLLVSVIELRAANWGRGPPSPTQSPVGTPVHSNIPMGTVYYGPGGVIQRVEDEPEDSASDTDDFVNSGWSPAVEELEGDVAEAFEEFLRLQQ